VAGLLRARLPELDLEGVPDQRAREGRWSLGQILRATLVGLMSGCRSLWEAEQLTEALSPAVRRRLLGLPRRLADTTARDALCRVPLDGLRAVLHRAARAAWRRKALEPVGLPFGVVALDGKATSLPTLNHPLVQNHIEGQVMPFGLVRTVTCSLVSAAGRPCIDAIPMPATGNEASHFKVAFASLLETYGALFDVVTYDAGALSEANASAVVAAGKQYLFTLKGDQRTMYKLAAELIDPREVAAESVDVLDNQTTVTRTLSLLAADPSWSYGEGKGSEDSVWRHASTFMRVEYVKRHRGEIVERDARMFVSSLQRGALAPEKWLLLVRSHWGVESVHQTLDTAFAEDDRPWIEVDPHGMIAVLLQRRIAYTLLALFRAASRTDEGRAIRWRALLAWIRDVLVAATENQLTGLRQIAAATR
jgi:hypothetical protein